MRRSLSLSLSFFLSLSLALTHAHAHAHAHADRRQERVNRRSRMPLVRSTTARPPHHCGSDGAVAYNSTAFNEWEAKGIAPAVPANLDLYKKLVNLGFKIVFLTGRSETYRNITIKNLKNVGYTTWEKLILKPASESSTTALVYKSSERAKLVAEGYKILGNMGDQWSDLFGTNVGNRTFKVPDPMYYIS